MFDIKSFFFAFEGPSVYNWAIKTVDGVCKDAPRISTGLNHLPVMADYVLINYRLLFVKMVIIRR